jgi:hypothetical protein
MTTSEPPDNLPEEPDTVEQDLDEQAPPISETGGSDPNLAEEASGKSAGHGAHSIGRGDPHLTEQIGRGDPH